MNVDQPSKKDSFLPNPHIQKENEFERMIHKAQVGVVKIGLDGMIHFANQKICSLLHITPESVKGKNYLDFYGSESNAGYSYWNELFKNGGLPFYNGWVDLTTTKGEILPCHLNMQQIQDDHSKPSFFMCIFDRFEEEQLLQQQIYEQRITHQQNISGAILIAQEKERAFLAEELHDNINQLLATAKLYVESVKTAKPERVPELLDKSAEHIVNVIKELRSLSKTLTPPSLDRISLLENVRNLFQDTEMITGINVVINKADQFDETILNDEKKIMVYRMLQEQFNNIIKHANASRINVTLKNTRKLVELIVEDDGIGFNMDDTKQGLGLKNIRNRAVLYNGRLSIQSAPGKGCRMHVDFEA